jgi:molybdopterin biosynthesis enzyme
MITFELFVAPAIELLSGYTPRPLPLFKAELAHPIDEKGSVAHFLPARLSWPEQDIGAQPQIPRAEVLLWEGSGDIGAVVRGNCFLVVHASRLKLEAGDSVDVLVRRGTF